MYAECLNRWIPNSARWVCGETPKDERRRTVLDYAAGAFPFLTNFGCFGEGFDNPKTEIIFMGRPTKSRIVYSQQAGRATRALPGVVDGLPDAAARRAAIAASGKKCATLVDFFGNCGRHRLVSAADILGGNYTEEAVAEAIRSLQDINLNADGKPRMVADELEKARKELEAEKERERQRKLKLRVKVKYATTAIEVFDVLDISPPVARGWDSGKKLSEKQASLVARQLKSFNKKLSDEDAMSQARELPYVKAKAMIDEFFRRWNHVDSSGNKDPLASPAQIRLLEKHRIDARNMTAKHASSEISRIAEYQGWGKKKNG
jgi:superfamily II DNA or RNA helicase